MEQVQLTKLLHETRAALTSLTNELTGIKTSLQDSHNEVATLKLDFKVMDMKVEQLTAAVESRGYVSGTTHSCGGAEVGYINTKIR